jgi:hypothetical protein
MRRQTQHCVSICGEQLIKDRLRSQSLRSRRLRRRLPEQEIKLRESRLNRIFWETSFDISEVGTGVTSMDIDSFAQELFDFRDEGVFGWEVEAAE